MKVRKVGTAGVHLVLIAGRRKLEAWTNTELKAPHNYDTSIHLRYVFGRRTKPVSAKQQLNHEHHAGDMFEGTEEDKHHLMQYPMEPEDTSFSLCSLLV